jgi:hypothetical protein
MAVDASAIAMASLRICVPFQMRSEIEPRGHIMKASVAAQGWVSPALLPKSLSQKVMFFRKLLSGFDFLGCDKPVLTHRVQDLIDRRARLDVHGASAGRRSDRCTARTDHLLLIYDD